MWSTADPYLDLAASAADATEHFRDQEDHEVEKLFWSQFHNPERPLSVADRLAEWDELNRLSGLAMKCVMSHLWPGRPEPNSYFSLVQQFLGAVPHINAMKRSACVEGARMALARCRCQNRRISGRGSRTVRQGRMITGDKGHFVLPRFGPSRWR